MRRSRHTTRGIPLSTHTSRTVRGIGVLGNSTRTQRDTPSQGDLPSEAQIDDRDEVLEEIKPGGAPSEAELEDIKPVNQAST